MIEKIKETKSGLFEKILKIDKHLARLIKGKNQKKTPKQTKPELEKEILQTIPQG